MSTDTSLAETRVHSQLSSTHFLSSATPFTHASTSVYTDIYVPACNKGWTKSQGSLVCVQ